MRFNINECTRQDLVRLISDYVKRTPYTDKEEIADSILDGSWVELFNCEWERKR